MQGSGPPYANLVGLCLNSVLKASGFQVSSRGNLKSDKALGGRIALVASLVSNMNICEPAGLCLLLLLTTQPRRIDIIAMLVRSTTK